MALPGAVARHPNRHCVVDAVPQRPHTRGPAAAAAAARWSGVSATKRPDAQRGRPARASIIMVATGEGGVSLERAHRRAATAAVVPAWGCEGKGRSWARSQLRHGAPVAAVGRRLQGKERKEKKRAGGRTGGRVDGGGRAELNGSSGGASARVLGVRGGSGVGMGNTD